MFPNDAEARRAAWECELHRLRCEVARCEAWHDSLVARAGTMRRGGFVASAGALEGRARDAKGELERARTALRRAEGST